MQQRFILISVVFGIALFLGMLLCLELGRRFGLRQMQKYGDAARSGVGVADSAVYALLALLLGFAFSGATSRYDDRRELVLQEVGAIKTAWHRIDLLPPARQPPIRADLRRYTDALLDSYAKNPASPGARQASAAAVRAQHDLWSKSVAACIEPDGEKARMLLLPALNEMFAVVTRERLAWLIHPPIVIYAMLAMSALAAALFAGYSMAKGSARNWLFIVVTAAVISIVMYVIIEIEFPRIGLIRVNAVDQTLSEVRALMR